MFSRRERTHTAEFRGKCGAEQHSSDFPKAPQQHQGTNDTLRSCCTCERRARTRGVQTGPQHQPLERSEPLAAKRSPLASQGSDRTKQPAVVWKAGHSSQISDAVFSQCKYQRKQQTMMKNEKPVKMLLISWQLSSSSLTYHMYSFPEHLQSTSTFSAPLPVCQVASADGRRPTEHVLWPGAGVAL